MSSLQYKDLLGPNGTENNMGGTQQFFFFARHAEIASFGVPPANPADADDAYAITTAHTMRAGKFFHTMYCTMDTGDLESGSNGEIDGKSFKPVFKFLYPGTRKDAVSFANRCKNDKFIVIVPLADGTRAQLGSQFFCAYITPNFKSGTTSGRGKGWEFEVTAFQGDFMVYEAAVPTEIPVDPVVTPGGSTGGGTTGGGGTGTTTPTPTPSAGIVPAVIASGTTYTVAAGVQQLHTQPIHIRGDLKVRGNLIPSSSMALYLITQTITSVTTPDADEFAIFRDADDGGILKQMDAGRNVTVVGGSGSQSNPITVATYNDLPASVATMKFYVVTNDTTTSPAGKSLYLLFSTSKTWISSVTE